MGGATLPAMSNSGSGNQGITATMPVVVVAEHFGADDERLARALMLSHLSAHAIKMDSFRDVWMLRSKYVAFVLMGESFLRSPAFTVPESAQRWANQIRQEGEVTE